MLLYKDVFCGDELCSDSYPSTKLFGGAIMEVSGAMISIAGGISDALIGGNASAEDEAEGTDDAVAKGINVVLTHKLVEVPYDKKSYKESMKDLFGATVKYLKENDKADQVDDFKKNATLAMKEIMSRFKEWQFYSSESMDPEACIVLGNYREDGVTPYFWFFTHCMEEEKY